MEIWQTILLAFGGNAALIAVLGLLGKSLLEKVIVRDAKRFELELKATCDATIERLKSELQLRTIEHQVKFSRLHEKSAETIAETYALLRKYLIAVADYVKIFEPAGDKPKSERREAVNEALKAFRDYFEPRQIFLPKDTAGKVRQLDEKLLEAAKHFARKIEGRETTATAEDWMKAFDTVNKEIPPVLELLEDDFRRILGQTNSR
ncbi:MAG: hypothetical protein Q7J61_00915 [Deltaproteobacteria bacterium]|nr:hypothetical protein [Deltaproteobacteria bacterium]